jgi:hypothetical protein
MNIFWLGFLIELHSAESQIKLLLCYISLSRDSALCKIPPSQNTNVSAFVTAVTATEEQQTVIGNLGHPIAVK